MGLDQAELARRVGVTRQWVIDIEKGKPRAELGLVMRALHALELTFLVESAGERRAQLARADAAPDINEVLARLSNRRVGPLPSLVEILKQESIARREASASMARSVRAARKKGV